MNTADLAATGWHQVSAATLLGPRAEMVLMTFREGELDGVRVTLRCATGFSPSGPWDRCERPDTSHAVGEGAEE